MMNLLTIFICVLFSSIAGALIAYGAIKPPYRKEEDQIPAGILTGMVFGLVIGFFLSYLLD